MFDVATKSVSVFLVLSALVAVDSTIDLNVPEMQYLSDHLTQEECRRLVAALHFQSFNLPPQAKAAERKLPEDLTCLQLLLHWNSEAGEGKGGSHVEVCHRLGQIGRKDLSEWLSKTVFHELSKDLDESLTVSATEETTRRAVRVTQPVKKSVDDEAPWLNLDSVLAVLVIIAFSMFFCGVLYMMTLCCSRLYRASVDRSVAKKIEANNIAREAERRKSRSRSSSEDETAKLISKRGTVTK